MLRLPAAVLKESTLVLYSRRATQRLNVSYLWIVFGQCSLSPNSRALRPLLPHLLLRELGWASFLLITMPSVDRIFSRFLLRAQLLPP